ncbi:hypothetical protein [Draconibacterium orientale]|uniref:hypothetical protein n=1 Tax=Draconibacterium orientale TaxID=1168034 RepID=UPI0029C0F10A|nr:hypothetical protein [Draconibacterium orientale]
MEHKTTFWNKRNNWFIPFISELYPLTKFQLIQYEEMLDWSRVKANQFINWSDDVKDCFAEKLSEVEAYDSILYVTEGIPISPGYQSENKKLFREDGEAEFWRYWNNILFGFCKVADNYDEKGIMQLLRSFDCTVELNERPFDSLPIPTNFIRERKETLPWDVISRYWGLKWSMELLEEFQDYWVAESLIQNHTAFNYCLKGDLNDKFIEKVLG